MIRKILKTIGGTLAGFVGLAIALYLIALAINWSDQEPSAAAIRFSNLYRDRASVADADNGYIYSMGFDVAPGSDPGEMGARRVAWLANSNQTGHFDDKEDPHNEPFSMRMARAPSHQEIVMSCSTADIKCADALGDERAIEEWLSSEGWLLQRYQVLLNHSGWLESVPFDAAAPLPPYHNLMDAQKLLFAQATILAKKRDYAGVKALLSSDIRFWRHVLESSDILLSTMIATSALRQHFTLGNLVLRKLPLESVGGAVPVEWQIGITDSERSMLRCYVGEWVWVSNIMRQAASAPNDAFSFDSDGSDLGVGKKIFSRSASPMFQLQDSINQRAEFFAELVETLSVPYDQYEAAIRRADELANKNPLEPLSFGSVYNIVGRILQGMSGTVYNNYSRRVADIEGIRRAALAAIELREAQIPSSEVAIALSQSALRNPYNNEPLSWDAERAAVVFTGLALNEQGTYFMLY